MDTKDFSHVTVFHLTPGYKKQNMNYYEIGTDDILSPESLTFTGLLVLALGPNANHLISQWGKILFQCPSTVKLMTLIPISTWN